MSMLRRSGLLAAAAAAAAAIPAAAAHRFAIVYRRRAGFPRRVVSDVTPADLGLAYEDVVVPSAGLTLPGWFMPAAGPVAHGARAPGIVLVHGWESARHRTLPIAAFLVAAGFHVLAFDVRGHGANPPENAPITGGEYGDDAAAAVRTMAARPEVARVGVLGHSMGGIGALLAAASEPLVAAVVAMSTPADPQRLTRLTFRLAGLPIPGPVAYPLAWWTARVYAQPRGHRVADVSASEAIRRIEAPILLVHGAADQVVPLDHMERLASLAPEGTTTYIVDDGAHSWLYEDVGFRRTVAAFLAGALGSSLSPREAGDLAAAVDARRIIEPEEARTFSAVDEAPRGARLAGEIAGLGRGRRGEIP